MKHEFAFLTPEQLARPLPISIGLSGGSGSGKTYSALRVARGIAEELGGKGAPIAFVDTENRRALHYRETFPEIVGHYLDFGPEVGGQMVGYPSDRWIAMLDFIEKSGAMALVVDSWSGSWEGIGGVLEQQAAVLAAFGEGDGAKGDANNIRAWAKVKPPYRKLINRVIQFPIPIILCTRAKPVIMKRQKVGGEWTDVPVGKTKTRRKDIPWDVAADGDLIFEMAAMAILDHEHPGCPKYQVKIADQFKRLWLPDRPLTEETGRGMAEWSKRQGSAQQDKALMDAARAKAREGKDMMRAYWQGLDANQIAILKPILAELQETAARADEQTAPDDPFSDPKPTPEQMAAAAAADEAAIRERDAQFEASA